MAVKDACRQGLNTASNRTIIGGQGARALPKGVDIDKQADAGQGGGKAHLIKGAETSKCQHVLSRELRSKEGHEVNVRALVSSGACGRSVDPSRPAREAIKRAVPTRVFTPVPRCASCARTGASAASDAESAMRLAMSSVSAMGEEREAATRALSKRPASMPAASACCST